MYYLEMVIGQFSSRSSIKAFDLCPITRGMFVGPSKLNRTTRIYLGLSFAVIKPNLLQELVLDRFLQQQWQLAIMPPYWQL